MPVVAFGALVVATVAAFFITQHLKVTTPLIAGLPRPFPQYINPLAGRSGICGGVDHRTMHISFYLLHRSDTVDVFVLNRSASIVATLATGRYMRRRVRRDFSWNGRESDGRIAPDGVYYIRVALLGQGRTVDITNQAGQLQTVVVDTQTPVPRVLSAQPHLIEAPGAVAIRYTGTDGRGASALVYRTDSPGRPELIKTFGTFGGTATWDSRIGRRAAPAGVYLVGLRVRDAACNLGVFPGQLPPPPGTTPGAGVTVRYLAAEPPSTAVAPGSRVTVLVDARRHPYKWSLGRPGARRPLAAGRSRSVALSVPIPGNRPGLYELALRWGSHTASVALVAHAARPAKVLVVLPALTWQGLNPGDEDADGVPDTLADGSSVLLTRAFAGGLPSGLGDEEGLLGYLDSVHQSYDLTTDVSLIEGFGTGLAGHPLVILAGTEQWITPSLAGSLRSYVESGGHVVSLGLGSMLRSVTVSGDHALDPTPPQAADALGARPGTLVTRSSQLIGVIEDGLGIFTGTSGLLSGFHAYVPFSVGPGATVVSAAGVTPTAQSVVAYRLGNGIVTDIGLPGFGSMLARDIDAQQLMSRLVALLGR